MDSDLVYSADALSAKATFYNKDFSIFVEGKEDLIFWKNICEYANVKNFHIEDVGGTPIKDYIKLIEIENAEFIVACDLNYNDFLGTVKKNNKIIYTYGHSIENTMYFLVERINLLLRTLTKTLHDFEEQISSAISDMIGALETLIIYDIANFIFDKSIPVLTNNCHKFLSPKTFKLNQQKIQETIDFCRASISDEEFNLCRNKVIKSKKNPWFLIRGHFLASWILKLVRTIAERHSGFNLNLSYEALYSLFINCDKNQKDVLYLRRKMKMAVQEFYLD